MVVDSIDIEPPSPFRGSGRGISYEFINDSIVDTKRRYFKVTKSETRKSEYKFIGTTTHYKILGDSLRLFNMTDSIWEKGKYLKKITEDSLILINSNGRKQTFLRYNNKADNSEYVDLVALSSSGCFGTCPIMNIIIDSTGGVVFYGERHIDKLGFFEGKIPKERFNKIKNELRDVHIKKLERDYSVDWTDDETISTTFISKNEFVNSIEDYGEVGPVELIWIYTSLRYLFQDIELKRLDSTKIPFYLDLHYFRFERGSEICNLTQSESFLLWNYLRKGSHVETTATNRFQVNFVRNYTWFPHYDEMDDPYKEKSEEKVRTITTDGRFYTFDIMGQEKVTIDIGFNFFDLNQKFLRFREKGEYD